MASFQINYRIDKKLTFKNIMSLPPWRRLFLFKHFFDDKSYKKNDDRDDGSNDYKFHKSNFLHNPSRVK